MLEFRKSVDRDSQQRQMTGIIVGVDGSDASRLALGWAMHEAAVRRLPLTVMTLRPVPGCA
jgi:nucleotide-binding universal stress UspA family protein